jgi:hypothetical protein
MNNQEVLKKDVISGVKLRRVKAGLHVPFTIVSRPKEGEMVATIEKLSTNHLSFGRIAGISSGHMRFSYIIFEELP